MKCLRLFSKSRCVRQRLSLTRSAKVVFSFDGDARTIALTRPRFSDINCTISTPVAIVVVDRRGNEDLEDNDDDDAEEEEEEEDVEEDVVDDVEDAAEIEALLLAPLLRCAISTSCCGGWCGGGADEDEEGCSSK